MLAGPVAGDADAAARAAAEQEQHRQSLYAILSCMRDIRKRTDRTDAVFEPLQRTVALLQVRAEDTPYSMAARMARCGRGSVCVRWGGGDGGGCLFTSLLAWLPPAQGFGINLGDSFIKQLENAEFKASACHAQLHVDPALLSCFNASLR